MSNMENVSKRKLVTELTNMTNLMFRIAGELYVVNPGSKIFHDNTFNRDNLNKIANVATFLMREASDWKPDVRSSDKI